MPTWDTMNMIDLACFWSKVEIDDINGCWMWRAASTGTYGTFRGVRAHRLAWELANSKPLGDLYACHHCDTPLCVNPGHLFPGTHQDNMRDMVEKNIRRRAEETDEKLEWG